MPPKSPFEQICAFTQTIEQTLMSLYGASGRGLTEKVISVESQLPGEIVQKIRKISSVRNKAVHVNVNIANDEVENIRQLTQEVLTGLIAHQNAISSTVPAGPIARYPKRPRVKRTPKAPAPRMAAPPPPRAAAPPPRPRVVTPLPPVSLYASTERLTASRSRAISPTPSSRTAASAASPAAVCRHRAGDRMDKIVQGIKFTFRWCPAGMFAMGCSTTEAKNPLEKQHPVNLTTGFWMLETPVTQKMWQNIMRYNPSSVQGDTLPVVGISWNDCQVLLRTLSIPGLALSLPTEAQWEYACRAGTTGTYAGDLDTMGWYYNNSDEKMHPVGQKKPNAWNIYDMHGNVWEWCQDWYGAYPDSSVTDPMGPAGGTQRVIRGGSWSNGSSNCRSAARGGGSADSRNQLFGLRLVGLER